MAVSHSSVTSRPATYILMSGVLFEGPQIPIPIPAAGCEAYAQLERQKTRRNCRQ